MPQTLPAIEAALEKKAERLVTLHTLYKDVMDLLLHHQREATRYLNEEVECWERGNSKEARKCQTHSKEHLEAAQKIQAEYGGVLADFQELSSDVEALQLRRDALLDLENL